MSDEIVVLIDPSNTHGSLDDNRYTFFNRYESVNDRVLDLITTRRHNHIDLYVPSDFTFETLRQYPYVHIHAYFVYHDDTSSNNVIEREKIRESIRKCCENCNIEYIEQGVSARDERAYNRAIEATEANIQGDFEFDDLYN